jgi:uncharacterized membrane protein
MNIKRIFGALLTALGIAALIYTAMFFVNNSSSSEHHVKSLLTYGMIGLLFFIAGVNLIKTIKDQS